MFWRLAPMTRQRTKTSERFLFQSIICLLLMMAALSLARLINRKLIRITGPDCYPYLQGLFCNDLRYLYEPTRVPPRKHANVSSSVMSSFMLNAQGRVVCDILLYRTPRTRYECSFSPPGAATEHDELLIECDSDLASGLANTLFAYRVRRKVSLEMLPDHQVWCLYPDLKGLKASTDEKGQLNDQLTIFRSIRPTEILEDHLTILNDPRIDLMGLRIIAKASDDTGALAQELKSRMKGCSIIESSVKDYILHRYNLGIGEGGKDHPEGQCLPLECNADYLGSVSFDKGCYLGQELTTRIHYTGVVRKRLMPTMLEIDKNKPLAAPLIPGSDVVDENSGKKLGVLRHVVRNRALSLLRTDLINAETKVIHEASKVRMNIWKPYWWNTD